FKASSNQLFKRVLRVRWLVESFGSRLGAFAFQRLLDPGPDSVRANHEAPFPLLTVALRRLKRQVLGRRSRCQTAVTAKLKDTLQISLGLAGASPHTSQQLGVLVQVRSPGRSVRKLDEIQSHLDTVDTLTRVPDA